MKQKIALSVAVLVVFMAALSAQASAITCSDFNFDRTYDYLQNNAFLYYENPSWTPQTVNLTLTLPGGLNLVSGSNPMNNFNGNIYNWTVNSSAVGNYTVSLTVDEGATTCTKSTYVDLRNPTDPVLQLSMTDVTQEQIANPFQINVNMNNTGAGSAANISLHLDLMNANSDSPKSLSVLQSGGTNIQTFTVTSLNTCAYYTARVRADYWNANGTQMPSSYASDTFKVDGPDLIVDSVTVTPDNTPEGSSVGLSATVKNIGPYSSQGPFTVTFYRGDPNSGGMNIGNVNSNTVLSTNTSTQVSTTWTSSGTGNFTVYAVITSAMECLTNNNQNTYGNNLTLTSSCGDGYCNGGEGCGSCSNDCGACPVSTAGGGGGGGGGSSYATGSCIVNWNCTEWSECVDGVQTRSCNYTGNCLEEYASQRKPKETQACEIPAENVTIPGPGPGGNETGLLPDGLTGLIIANAVPIAVGAVIAVILIGAAAYLLRKPSNGTGKKK